MSSETYVTKQLTAAKDYVNSYLPALKEYHKDVVAEVANRGNEVFIRVRLTDEIGRPRKFIYEYNKIKKVHLSNLVTLQKDWEHDL